YREGYGHIVLIGVGARSRKYMVRRWGYFRWQCGFIIIPPAAHGGWPPSALGRLRGVVYRYVDATFEFAEQLAQFLQLRKVDRPFIVVVE
ncbi:hypothetical protein, partial [Pseudomonas aeruginosa]|uniref:hypothetical protein n=1 Tax=Pseudomonas aeruginosa TaxID=287 RepID=UPI0034A30638